MICAKNGLLAACFLLVAGVHAQTPGPSMALATTPDSKTAETATRPVEDWYACGGTVSVEAAGQKWSFSDLRLRKIDGESFELKGTGKDAAMPAFVLYVKTFNPALILRPGLTYVSEGNLEAGETFTLSLQGATPATSLTSTSTGCVLRVASVRGSTVKGDVKGSFETPAGPSPFSASFDLIDARYGQ